VTVREVAARKQLAQERACSKPAAAWLSVVVVLVVPVRVHLLVGKANEQSAARRGCARVGHDAIAHGDVARHDADARPVDDDGLEDDVHA
jgi:hypothetical protein